MRMWCEISNSCDFFYWRFSISHWTLHFHTLFVKFSTAGIFSIEEFNFNVIRFFHTPGWNFPTAMISSVEDSHWTWRCHSIVVNFPTAVITSDEHSDWTWCFHIYGVNIYTPVISPLEILIEPDAFTSRVWIFPQLCCRLSKCRTFSMNLTLSHPGVNLSTAAISRVRYSHWFWRFHTPVWICPLLWFSLLKIPIKHHAFTTRMWKFKYLWFSLFKFWIYPYLLTPWVLKSPQLRFSLLKLRNEPEAFFIK